MATPAEKEPSSPTENKQLPTPPPERADVSGIDGTKDALSNPKVESPSEQTAQVAASSSDKADGTKTSNTENSSPETDIKEKKHDSSTQTDSDNSKKDEPKDDSPKDKDTKAKPGEGSDSDDKSKKKDDEKKEEEKKKSLPRGMKAGVKLLWAKTDAQCKCCTTWVEENPDDGTNVEESDECLQHAIVVRKKKKHEGNRKPLKVDSIVVHSPLIKKVLQKVFTGYPDLVVDLEELVFDAPFSPFFHRWESFEKAKEEESDPLTKSHLTLLYDALAAELKTTIQRHKDLVRHKAIDFEILWTLYTPGSLMYSHDNGHDRLYQTGECEYWQDLSGMKFTVRCEMIEWDGEKFGKVMLSENISKFKGTRQITTLPSYPLRFHPKAEEMKAKCIARGKRFQELTGVHCKDYKGTGIEYTKYSVQTVESKRHIEGRIMLDEELFAKFNPDEAHDVRELDEDDEDVKKAESEAAQRLEKQAKTAAEALAKAEKEEKEAKEKEAKEKAEKEKKEKEAKEKTEKDKKDESTKEEEAKPKEETKADEADKKQEVKSEDAKSSSEKTDDKQDPQPTVTSGAKDDSGADAENVSEASPKPSETKEEPSAEKDGPKEENADDKPTETTVSEKKDDEMSSADSDSTKPDIPTPASEYEDTEKDTQQPGENSSEPTVDPKPFSSSEKQKLKENQLAICSSWLRGYSLTYQKWASFSVEHISDVCWNDNAFNELTLPPEYRELILATIQSQIRQNQWKQKMEKVDKEQKSLAELSSLEAGDEEDGNPAEFDDFIAQKGLGYIMLFSGNPGVGKTATAESIAELLHVPLCIISVGNLGTSAESVESALQDILELASKWNAVLLLDEADIFLEQRTKHDLHRNAVVSVFLRLLEYYQGVLCLTTNRSEEIDVAFHSRIHISLPFPDLTEANREQIWRHFARITNKKHESSATKRALKSASTSAGAPPPTDASSETVATSTNGDKTTTTSTTPSSSDPHCVSSTSDLINLSNSDFRKLSQTPLNGRQIKNAFKTAVLLASYKKEKVMMKHVKTALKTIDGNGLGKREVGRMYY